MSRRVVGCITLLLGALAAQPVPAQIRAPRNTRAASKTHLPDFDVRDSQAEQPYAARDQAKALVARRHAGIAALVASPAAAGGAIRITPNRYGIPKTYFR